MTNKTIPRCHFLNCRNAVTHTVQRLWQLPGRAPFTLQHCCDEHIPGSFDKDSLFMRRLRAHGRGLSPFYRVEQLQKEGE